MNSRVSILVPCFNAEKYISDTLHSIINQSYPHWDALVLDDCSTDNSLQIAAEISQNDERIKVVRNKHNLGMMANWNKGIDLCGGEFFVKLDADDIWKESLLESSVEVMDNDPDVGMVICRYVRINNQGILIPNSESTPPDFARDSSFNCIPLVQSGQHKMLQYDILRQGICLTRRKIFDEIGKYLSIQSADTELYFRIGAHKKIYGIDEVLYFYREHQSSDSVLIEKEGKRSLYLLQAKEAILKYYSNQKIISENFCNENVKKARFIFSTRKAFQLRKNRFIIKWLFYTMMMFFRYPIDSFTFYSQRISTK